MLLYYLYLFICLYYIIGKEIALIYFEQYFSNNLSKFCVESHKIFKYIYFYEDKSVNVERISSLKLTFLNILFKFPPPHCVLFKKIVKRIKNIKNFKIGKFKI